ncbi:unnamed protein product [Victoria cruziana]
MASKSVLGKYHPRFILLSWRTRPKHDTTSTITRRLLGRIDRKPRHLEPVRRHFSKDGFCFGKVPSENQVLRSILREYRPDGIDQDCWFEQLRGLPPEATVDSIPDDPYPPNHPVQFCIDRVMPLSNLSNPLSRPRVQATMRQFFG